MAQSAPLLPELGATLSGKYQIVRRIGEGGMGVVYEATHTRIKQRVAIKMLLPELMNVPDIVSRFEREARAAGQLRSNNVARVLDVDTTADGLPYMVMEFLEGYDLGYHLEKSGAMPIPQAVDFVLQTCNAMREAHKLGIVHRDLKPSNLFLTVNEGRSTIKVLDFGISKVDDEREARVTGTQATVGTPLYMSPEQIRSAKHVDARSDIWSLGIILYELLAGKTPYEGSTTAAAVAICVDPVPSLRVVRPDVPLDLEQIILRALAKERDQRFQTVDDFAYAISPYGTLDISAVHSAPSLPVLAQSGVHILPSLPHAMTEASSPGFPAKRPGALTESPWASRATSGKKRGSMPLLIPLGVGVLAAVGIVAALALRPRQELSPAIDPPKPTAVIVTTTESTTSEALSVSAPPPPSTAIATSTQPPKTAATVRLPPPPVTTSVKTTTPPPPTSPTTAPTRL